MLERSELTGTFRSDEIVSEALEFAKIPAPPGHEEERAQLVERKIRDAGGWRVWRDAQGNVLATPRPDKEEDLSGACWLLVHLDSVFPLETPLEFKVLPNLVSGPGIGDNAIAVTAALHVIRHFQLGPNDARPLVIAFTVGEESHGNLRGARHLLSNEARHAHAVIAVEGHRGNEIANEMPASARYSLRTTTEGGHSWWDRGRPSAVHEIVDFLAGLLKQADSDERMAVNVGQISGGTGLTAIAQWAEASFECRSTDNSAIERFGELVDQLTSELTVPYELQEIGTRTGGVLAPEHQLIALAQRSRALASLPPAVLGSSSSDANPFIAAGIPAITVGITTGRKAHQIDEEIDVEPVAGGTLALLRLSELLCERGAHSDSSSAPIPA